jgi:hypothetical protein
MAWSVVVIPPSIPRPGPLVTSLLHLARSSSQRFRGLRKRAMPCGRQRNERSGWWELVETFLSGYSTQIRGTRGRRPERGRIVMEMKLVLYRSSPLGAAATLHNSRYRQTDGGGGGGYDTGQLRLSRGREGRGGDILAAYCFI